MPPTTNKAGTRSGTQKITKKQRILQAARGSNTPTIGDSEWASLREALPDISESRMREVLREAGFGISPPWAGVEQHTFAELRRSLTALAGVYAENPDLRSYCRQTVIEAKTRARWAAKSPNVEEGTRGRKTEMVEWMLVWLSDPAVFPAWVELRTKALANEGKPAGSG